VIVVNWHRQKGKDFTAAAKAVRHALRSGQSWFIVSLTQRQADATFDKCKRVAKALMAMLKIAGQADELEPELSVQWDKELKQSFQFLARTIRLPGGGTVTSLPGRDPDTLAGLTGNVIFTEFGLFPGGGYDHWRVVFPLATRGFQVIVISTPRGKNTKFYELCQNLDAAYSVHFCDIHHSLAHDGFVLRGNDGQPTTLLIFKKLYGDATGFEREYECKFTGDASALITWAEIERAAGLANPDGFVYRLFEKQDQIRDVKDFAGALTGRRLAIGWDVARHGHLSAVSVNTLNHNQPSRLIAVLAMKECSFEFMRHVVMSMMDMSRSSVGYGDATGLGMESNETLQKKYRDRWTPFTFTVTGKREVASALKTAFTDGTQTLPPLDGPHKFVATDLYAIQKDDSGSSFTLSESENPLLEASHCDIAYAIGLARLAGAQNTQMPVRAPLARKPDGW
jgi:phage FluMu gp28-like protein